MNELEARIFLGLRCGSMLLGPLVCGEQPCVAQHVTLILTIELPEIHCPVPLVSQHLDSVCKDIDVFGRYRAVQQLGDCRTVRPVPPWCSCQQLQRRVEAGIDRGVRSRHLENSCHFFGWQREGERRNEKAVKG